jgi:hypothetical protein
MKISAGHLPRSHNFLALLILSCFSLLAVWVYYDSRLVLDDWVQIANYYAFGALKTYAWGRARPLDLAAYKAISDLFGLNIFAYYFINTLIIVGIFFTVYTLIDRLLPRLHPFALIVSAIALLYPADYTLTWITMINNRLAWLITLVGMLLLYDYASRGNLIRLVFAALCMFLPLWIHEGSLGVVILWCIFIALISNRASMRSRLAILSPIIPLIIFVILRVIIRPSMNITDGHLTNLYNFTPELFWIRLKQITILAKAWLESLPELLRHLGFGRLSKGTILVGFMLLMGMVTLVVLALLRSIRLWENPLFSPGDRKEISHKLSRALLYAAGFLIAGYIPIIVTFPPNLEDISTRANMYSIPAAAVIITAIIGLIALALARSRPQWQLFLWIGALPLIIIGLVVQVTIQQRWHAAWEQQKSIWQQLFQIVPNFEDKTTVVLILKGYRRLEFAEHPPLYAQWEFDSALRVLYENDGLRGRILFPVADIFSESRLDPTKIVGAYQEETAYDHTVFLMYNPKNGRLKLVYDLEEELDLPFQVTGYNPERRIDRTINKNWQYRYLVDAQSERIP